MQGHIPILDLQHYLDFLDISQVMLVVMMPLGLKRSPKRRKTCIKRTF